MPERRNFPTREALAAAFAETVAADLAAGITERGVASLAVSGGSTPARFFRALGAHAGLDWQKVVVTLVDERWVDESSDRSNARLVEMDLLQGPAAAARFVPLYQGGPEPDDAAIARVIAAQRDVPAPFDAVVLGMGNDGHCASFFPGGDRLDEALTTNSVALAMRAAGAGEARVTLSLDRLVATRSLYLHIEGEQKARVLEQALGEGPVEDMPIRAVLRQTVRPVTIYWAP
jgi:6-phosphogluconolactonase